MNVAVTVVSVLMVRVQDPVPAQAPFQPTKEEPLAGSAVRVNTVPGVTDCEQVAPQLMIPAGALVIVPGPDLVTESVTGVRVVVTGVRVVLNVAVTVVAAVTVMAQEPVPEQAPLQPANVEPAAGAAVRVSGVPAVTDSEQSAPQLMPRECR